MRKMFDCEKRQSSFLFFLSFFSVVTRCNTRNSVAAVILIFLLAVVSSWHKATSMCEYCHWPQNLSQLEILCCCRVTTTTTLTKSLIKDNMSFRFSDGLFFHCRSPSHFRFTLSHVVDKHKVWRRESTQKTFFFVRFVINFKWTMICNKMTEVKNVNFNWEITKKA